MTFRSDLHRSVIATWMAATVGRVLVAGLAGGVAGFLIAAFADTGAAPLSIAGGVLSGACVLLFASAPLPNPDDYFVEDG